MAEYPWCTNSKQTGEQRKAAAEAFYAELESIHGEVSAEEWSEIIAPMNLADHDMEHLVDRPSSVVNSTWWNTTTPVEPWRQVKDIIFSPTEDSLYKQADNSLKTIEAFSFTGASQSVKNVDKTVLATKMRENREDIIKIVKTARPVTPEARADVLFQIKTNLDYLKLNLDSYVHTARMTATIDTTAAQDYKNYITSNFIVYVESLLSNIEALEEEVEKEGEDFCPTKEEIKQYYLNALLVMAVPEIAKKEKYANIGAFAWELLAAADGIAGDWEREKAQELRDLATSIEEQIQSKIEASAREAFATEAVFREQCFIITNLPKFVKARQNLNDLTGLPYALNNYNTPELIERLEREDSKALKKSIDSNKPINVQGNAFPFINKLAINPNQAALFDLREEQISSLTPRIRLFKSQYNEEKGKEEEIEIKFDVNAQNDINQYLSRKGEGGRGLGVGVKGFTFSYDGTDPFSAKKAISAKLDIYAPNFSDLLRERRGVTEGGTSMNYKYVDLALKTGGNITDGKKTKLSDAEKENLDKLSFRIRVMIEFAASKEVLRTFRDEQQSYKQVLKNAVYDSAISIYLTPTIHEFNFDDAGGVEFSINYLAYIEDYFSTSNFDIFTETAQIKKVRNAVLKYFKEQDCDQKEGYEKFKEEDLDFIRRVNTQSLNKIIRELFTSQKIYFLNLNDQMIKEFFNKPFNFDVNLKKQSLSELEAEAKTYMDAVIDQANYSEPEDAEESTGTEGKKRKILASLVAYSENETKVPFMYLNDIVTIVMGVIEEKLRADYGGYSSAEFRQDVKFYVENIASSLLDASEAGRLTNIVENSGDPKAAIDATRAYQSYKQMRVILGPAEIGTGEGDPVLCSLGDIPISLNYFIDFMSEKVLSKTLSSYPLSKFIKDLITDCVKNFINEDSCLDVELGSKLQINSTTILAYDTKENKYTEDNLSDLIAKFMRVKRDEGKELASREVLLLNNVSTNSLPLLKVSGPRDDPRTFLKLDKMRNYYVFSAARRYPSDQYLGNRAVDAKNGIFHYTLGEDKGMLKTISLDKTSTPGLKELRFEQEGFAGLEQLREVYNANLSTFLNVQTFPGTYIYIEPKGFDPTATEDLSRFGIGGYYMITKTRHTIQPGNAETEINAAWVASKGTYVRGNKEKDDAQKGEEKQKKCGISFRS